MGVTVREQPKGSGIWYVVIHHRGQRKHKKIGRDKKTAEQVAEVIRAKLTLGQFEFDEKEEAPPVSCFDEYADTWINVTVPATCKHSTLMDYKYILKNHVLPKFGKTPVDRITKLMVKKFLMKKINDGFAASTVTHMKNAVSGVLGLAMDDGVLTENAGRGLGKVIKDSKLSLKGKPLTRDELSLLLKTISTEFPREYPLALTLARTGMRFGEASALQWQDINFDERYLMISRGFSRGRIQTPKSNKSRRVDMSKQLTEVLLALREQRKKEVKDNGWAKEPEWVFVGVKGNPIHNTHWGKHVFKPALAKAGLGHFRIHDLRHTYATLLLQAGESMTYVRDQLGHHSIKVTVDIYGHLAPGDNRSAVDKLDD